MADKLRLYVICPCCDGNELDVKEFDGLLHIYYGRFEEVVEE